MKLINADERQLLINTPTWTYKEICIYCSCSTTKAYEIMKEAKRKGGNVPFFSNRVKSSVVLQVIGEDNEDN